MFSKSIVQKLREASRNIIYIYIVYFASYANAASLANILPDFLVEWSFNWPSFAVLLRSRWPFSPNSFYGFCATPLLQPFLGEFLLPSFIHSLPFLYFLLSQQQVTDLPEYISSYE
jgi:hypothetical protein